MLKHDIDTGRIFTIQDFLDADTCAALIDRAERHRFDDAPINSGGEFVMRKDVRNNTRVMLDDVELAGELWSLLKPHMPATFGGRAVKELNERFRFYRYTPGQRFRPHVDGYFARGNGDKSCFTFMVYLNDDFHGGGTRFLEPFECNVQPETGMALVFYHHQVHEGCEVKEGTKYVLRTDVMYSANSE